MKVYVLTHSPDRGYDTISTDIFWIFDNKLNSEEAKEDAMARGYQEEDLDICMYETNTNNF